MPVVMFKYKGQSFMVIGTRKVGESWEHCIKCIETSVCKWKTDEWMVIVLKKASQPNN
jgi:hypothetical protein